MRDWLEHPFYVAIDRDRMRVQSLQTDRVTEHSAAFTTHRLLVGEFAPAEHCLRAALAAHRPRRLLAPRPVVLIHPLAMTEGGLCEIEQRVFRELGLGGGAHRVELTNDPTLLSAEQARHRLTSR